MNHKTAILRTISESKVDRIVLVTSGSWTMNKSAARRYLTQIEDAHAWNARELFYIPNKSYGPIVTP